MMWQIQSLLAGLLTAQSLNLAFALLCVLAMLGLCPKWVAGASAVLYVALAFV